MEPDSPSPAIDAAHELALSLAGAAGAGDLAEAAGEGDPGALLLDTLLTHELAIGHTLMARLAAQVEPFIGGSARRRRARPIAQSPRWPSSPAPSPG